MKSITTITMAALFGLAILNAQTRVSPAPRAADSPTVSALPDSGYVIGEQDVLNVTVWDNAELTGKYSVQPGGDVTIPVVGRVRAAGLSVGAFETALTRALADGFIRDPRVAVTLDQYRGKRIFVFGNVTSPGTYPLPEGQTLIEALVRAGYAAASEAVIVRPKHPTGPVMVEDAGDAAVLRVNLRELEKDVEKGVLARNLLLRDGDTIFIPRVDVNRIFVTGQVRSVGAYSITTGTTVLQALALAGGPTEDAAVNRMRIIRLIRGKQESLKVKLGDIVLPGDTIIVPERFF
jgi:polysaccharide export outer membrane protein